ncbi:MAG: hypothetical protein GY722_06080, partial [bacterium]|nr:hypothetical protein [bacterium]
MRIVVEYRDAANATVLDVFDSGDVVDVGGWHRLSDLKLAPAGTRFIRVRLITARWGGDNADGYFDGLAVRSLGTPVFQFSDQQIFEGDVGNDLVPYRVTLTCPSDHVVSLDYQLVDGTAVAPLDYVDQAGTLTFAAGEVEQTIDLEIVGEFLNELRETFTIEFSNEVRGALLDDGATITVRDADPGAPPVPGVFAVYTLDHEFDTGVAVSLNHDAPLGDQLQLNPEGSTFPFIWIAASDRGTIVKIDVATGAILGEYSTNPDHLDYGNPSRTTVALDGSVWVGNREDVRNNRGSVAHIGLPELNQCVDRNGNGVIDTSAGYLDRLPWPNPGGVDSGGG